MGALAELLTFVGTMLVGSVAWWLLSDDGSDDDGGGGGDGPHGPVVRPMPPCACAASVGKRHARRCQVGRPRVAVQAGSTAPSRGAGTRV
jgi:hypothetical protein